MTKTGFTLLFTLCFTCSWVWCMAQVVEEWNETDNLPRWMTDAEKERIHEIGKDFIASRSGIEGARNIAEFERMEGVLIRYPLGIPVELVAAMAEQVKVYTLVANTSRLDQAIDAYTNAGVNMDNCAFVEAATNSMWTRDYGPWFVATEDKKIEIVDFKYNRPRPLDDAIPSVMADYLGIERHGMDLIHCGGNYMSDSYGIAASTDLVLEENNFNETLINDLKFQYLGIHTYHITEDAQGEYIRHIDTWAKFLDVDKILIAQVSELNERYPIYEAIAEYYAQQLSSYGTPFQVYRVFSPQGQPYTNSLILNERVYVPITGSAWDDDALEVYRKAMPGYEVVGFRGSWISTDALHCRIIGLADRNMISISHNPIASDLLFEGDIQVNADMVAYGSSVLDSTQNYLIYSKNGLDYDTISMIGFGSDQFTSDLQITPGDTLVSYYFSVSDTTGRVAHWPMVGDKGPLTIRLNYKPEMTIYPDTLTFRTVEEATGGLEIRLENRTPVGISIDSVSVSSSDLFPWQIDEDNAEIPISLRTGDSVLLTVILPEEFSPSFEDILEDSLVLFVGQERFTIPLFYKPEPSLSAVSIENVKNLSVFPNPFTDAIQLSFDLEKAEGDIYVRLMDIHGITWSVRQFAGFDYGQQTLQWSELGHIQAGYYYLELVSDQGSSTVPVIKLK